MKLLAKFAGIVCLSSFALPVLGNQEFNVPASTAPENVVTYTIAVKGEFRDRSISLNDLLNRTEYRGYEVAGVDVVGRRASARTLLTLWINERVQNSEWMAEGSVTQLVPHKGWVLGENLSGIQVNISGSTGYVENVDIHLRAPIRN